MVGGRLEKNDRTLFVEECGGVLNRTHPIDNCSQQ